MASIYGEDPYEKAKKKKKPDTTMSVDPIAAAQNTISSGGGGGKNEEPKNDVPEVVRDKSGKITGVAFPDGRFFRNISPKQVNSLVDAWNRRSGLPSGARFSDEPIFSEEEQIRANFEAEQRKKEILDTLDVPDVTPEELAQIGRLSPEQLAELKNLPAIKRAPRFKEILSTVGERATIGAVGGVTGGAAVGAIGGAGVGAVPGAVVGGVLGGIGGSVSGVFASFKRVDVENVNDIKQQYDNAVYNIDQSISKVNDGSISDTEGTRQFNEAYLEILKAQQNYKQLEKRREWATDIKDKQVELQNYIDKILPNRISQMAVVQQKPTPDFIDYGVDEKGNVAVR